MHITNIISEDIDPQSVAKFIDMFVEYYDSLEDNTSLFEVFQRHTGFDSSSLLQPIKETLNSLHTYIGPINSKFYQNLQRIVQWSENYFYFYFDIFNMSYDDYCYTYYSSGWKYREFNFTKMLDAVFEKLQKEQFIHCNPSELVSMLDYVLDLTKPIKLVIKNRN